MEICSCLMVGEKILRGGGFFFYLTLVAIVVSKGYQMCANCNVTKANNDKLN